MPVFVTQEGPVQGLRYRRVQSLGIRYLRALGLKDCELSVLLCDDASIRALNRRHRSLDKPTDVLAFPQHEGLEEGGRPSDGLLGDVAISVDTARVQASVQGHSLVAEVSHLLAHGVLHLVGYDHQDDAQEQRMNAATERLLALGLRAAR